MKHQPSSRASGLVGYPRSQFVSFILAWSFKPKPYGDIKEVKKKFEEGKTKAVFHVLLQDIQ